MTRSEFDKKLDWIDGPNGYNAQRMRDPIREKDDFWKLNLSYTGGRRLLGGLGDAIALSGGAVWLAKRRGSIVFPVYPAIERDVRLIFQNHPLVMVKPWQQVVNEGIKEVCKLVYAENQLINCVQSQIDMYREGYRQARVPYWERWNSCPIEKAARNVTQVPIPQKPYVFVHDDSTRGMEIKPEYLPKMHLFRPNPDCSVPILSYVQVIKHASEIHCCDSCFYHLVESLHVRGRCVFHQYCRMYYVETRPAPIIGGQHGLSCHVSVWNDYLQRWPWKILMEPWDPNRAVRIGEGGIAIASPSSVLI